MLYVPFISMASVDYVVSSQYETYSSFSLPRPVTDGREPFLTSEAARKYEVAALCPVSLVTRVGYV